MGFVTNNINRRWPEGRIPFMVDSDLLSNTEAARAVRGAVDEWNNKTRIKLVELDPGDVATDYVKFQLMLTACQSHVGKKGGEQVVGCALTAGPFSVSSIIHEIGHAVGFRHEQQRPDRDSHVNVTSSDHNNRIEEGVLITPYDCASIMHYPLGTCPDGIITGMAIELSAWDIQTANGLELSHERNNTAISASNTGVCTLQPGPQDGDVWWYDLASGGWRKIGQDEANTAISASDNSVYILQSDGDIFKYGLLSNVSTRIASNQPAKSIVAGGTRLFQLHNNGIISIIRYE